ncbi:MAG: MBL fold metallo-hydrolase [Patescibacteria group bacterium]|nr:MBL fold metallo-hydrolase [Patescibacteria group bacterium]
MKIQIQDTSSYQITTKNNTIALYPKEAVKTEKAAVILSDTDQSSDTFVSYTPGEYELSGDMIQGIAGNDNSTVIYRLQAEGMVVAFLGNQKEKLTADQLDTLGNIDILFLPLLEDIKISLHILEQIEPRMIIPVGDQNSLSVFLESYKASYDEPSSSVSISESKLPIDNTKLVILKK